MINRLLDVALKACVVAPGALITERSYGTLEVHAKDQGQVREAGRRRGQKGRQSHFHAGAPGHTPP